MSIRGTRCARILLATVLFSTLVGVAIPRVCRAQEAAGEPAISPEDEEKARGHFRLGRAHYDNGNFAQAAVEFEEAYRISQRSALLYNIYLAYRDANDTRNAATSLRKYLELQKDVENRGQLEARLAALERSLADGTAPQPAQGPQPTPAPAVQPDAQPAPTEAAPAAATEPAAPEAERKHSMVPWILMGTGGAMVIGGTVFWGMSSGKKSDLDKKCPNTVCDPTTTTKKEVEGLKSSGSSLAMIGDILFFGGLAVGGTGAVLFILDMAKGGEASSDSADAPSASLACLPGTCGGSVSLKF